MARREYFNNVSQNAFCYSYEDVLKAEEVVLLKMPTVTPNKRGVNDIGFMADDNLTLYATISSIPDVSDEDIWQKINSYDEINKTTSYIKIVNNSDSVEGRVIIRAILN